MLPTFLIRLLILAITGLGITACNTCDDPAGPTPTEGLPDLMYSSFSIASAPVIYTSKADGSGQRPWATTSGYITETGMLMSSPRSGKIAFVTGSQDTEPVSLVISDISGANAVVLESDAEFNDLLFPVLSPDAKYVAVNKKNADLTNEIVVYTVATKTKAVVANDIVRESQVFFTPNSSALAYYTDDNRIVMMNVDGSNKRTLVTDAFNGGDYSAFLDFSPTGDRMVYMRHKQDPRQTDLAILTLSTGAVTTFRSSSTEIYGYPAWSPKGETIAFVRGTFGSSRTVLSIADANSSQDQRDLVNTIDNYAMYPQWSPDGNYVSATVTVGTDPDNGTFSVRVFNIASSTATLIGSDLHLAFWVR